LPRDFRAELVGSAENDGWLISPRNSWILSRPPTQKIFFLAKCAEVGQPCWQFARFFISRTNIFLKNGSRKLTRGDNKNEHKKAQNIVLEAPVDPEDESGAYFIEGHQSDVRENLHFHECENETEKIS
jgi:hypothetical protein